MRPLWAGLLTALVGVVGGSALTLQTMAANRPTEAASLVPWDNETQRQAAQSALKRGSPQSAAKFAMAALSAMPLDQFSLAASSTGKPADKRLAILNLAAAMGWRDPATNVALIQAALRESEVSIAAQRIDALGRTLGAEAALPFADRLLSLPGGTDALAERAHNRASGAWWQGYFRSQPASRETAERRAALIGQFDKADGAWLRLVIRDASIGFSKGGWDDISLGIWRNAQADDAPYSGPLFDPQFLHFDPSTQAIGSEWQLATESPALASRRPDGGVIVERTQDQAGPVLVQKLTLEPGQWKLRVGGGRVDESGAEWAGYEWRLSCSASPSLPIASTSAPLAGGILTSHFYVPKGCPIVNLTLFAKAGKASEASPLNIRRLDLERAK